MADYESELFPDEEVNRQHMAVAVIASVVSVGLHLGGLLYASHVDFALLPPLPALPAPPNQEQFTVPMRLEEVTREVRRVTGPDRSHTGVVSTPSDPAREVETTAELPTESGIEPPAVGDSHFIGEAESVAEPSDLPDRAVWEPRQEILMIEKRDVKVELGQLARRAVPKLERVTSAPDIVDSIRREDYLDRAIEKVIRTTVPHKIIATEPVPAVITQIPDVALDTTNHQVTISEPESTSGEGLFREDVEDITPYKPIERLLKARLVRQSGSDKGEYGYFRIEIERLSPDVLPVIPKDVILVQDSSASIAEQRLYFCRKGLIKCLAALGPEDRFNVMAFRDSSEVCFGDWQPVTSENVRRATEFISGMQSRGETDIYASIRDVLDLKRTPGRPVTVLLVTDGLSTTGITSSSSIIGQFTRLNDGAVSVITMGTLRTANNYLLDLLSYCNRGYSFVVTKGRWDIPESMPRMLESVRRPVMSDVRFVFTQGGGCEVYPRLTENLYLDRPLVLYGRFRRGTENVVFQAVGRALETECDMVFDLAMGDAKETRDKELPTIWAQQKIYHLLGQYARTPAKDVMREIQRTSRDYDVAVPYRGRF